MKDNKRLTDALDRFDLYTYVDSTFDPVEIAAGGDELRIDCFSPRGCRNRDTGRHLYINPHKKSWYCFKCGYGDSSEVIGSSWIPRFIADAEKIPIQSVIDRMICQTKPTPTDELRGLLEAAFERATPKPPPSISMNGKIKLPRTFFKLAAGSRPATSFLRYVKERGIDSEDIDKYDVRYCFSQDSRLWQGRVIFPIYDTKGDCRSAVGRRIKGDGLYSNWANWPKSDIKTLLWPVGVFGSSWKRVEIPETLVLTEGVFDCLAVNKLTDHQAVCTFGKKLSNGQIGLLRELGVKHIILAWDMDAKKQIKKIVEVLRGRLDVSVFPFQSPAWEENDFGDVLKSRDPHLIECLQNELDGAIHSQSAQFVAWVIR